MRSETFAELKCEGSVQPVFQGLDVQTELREALAITTFTQSYQNASKKNIEAVYTFPLPLDAVLLEMLVTLGDKTLKGTVIPKADAEERYEAAITEGDAPVMLQNPQPGVYTMNIGNLLPEEQVKIMIRYAAFQCWQGDTLRYFLPTTIAPRYSSSGNTGLEHQQQPKSSILVDNLFQFKMKIVGSIADKFIDSPSHEIKIERGEGGRESYVELVRKSEHMDRDLVITVKDESQQVSSTVLGRDGDDYMLWSSFHPQFDLPEDPTPRSVKIVVDCSASMAGDSIYQAREALLRVLDELRPQDWFNIVTFGDTATSLFNSQVQADKESLSYARGFLKSWMPIWGEPR
jgi:Ca-activated chloride channel family protein